MVCCMMVMWPSLECMSNSGKATYTFLLCSLLANIQCLVKKKAFPEKKAATTKCNFYKYNRVIVPDASLWPRTKDVWCTGLFCYFY